MARTPEQPEHRSSTSSRSSSRASATTQPSSTKALDKLDKAAGLGGGKTLYDANREVYGLLRYGAKVSPGLGEHTVTVDLIDWRNPAANDFGIAEEVTVEGTHTKRPDIVLYVNGIAIGVLELKRSTVSVSEGIRQNLDNQKKDFIQRFFSTAQLVMAGNETEGLRYGVIETSEKYWLRWKEAGEPDDDAPTSPLLCELGHLCAPERLLELIHDFVVFDAGVKKILPPQPVFRREGGPGVRQPPRGRDHLAHAGQWKEPHNGVAGQMDPRAQGRGRPRAHRHRPHRTRRADRKGFHGRGRGHLPNEERGRPRGGASRPRQVADLFARPQVRQLRARQHRPVRGRAAFPHARWFPGPRRDLRLRGRVPSHPVRQAPQGHEGHPPRRHAHRLHGNPAPPGRQEAQHRDLRPYIHTYKYDEAVDDEVVLDLRYEARDIDQNLTSEAKIDQWFNLKTKGLSDLARAQLRQKWGTMRKVTSSRDRIEKIVDDILIDMETRDRLKSGRGNAMLVSDSVYAACRFFEEFSGTGLKGRCAIVTSYSPAVGDIKGEETGEGQTEKLLKYGVYRKMLADHFGESEDQAMHKAEQFERQVKRRFVNEPGQMKLLIVVDKLLTGFDAPPATYLYIDKKMQDHGLFQAICRVNRLDGDDKEYGYIIDYKDLFRSLEGAIKDYTGEAFENYDREDVEGLLKDRLEQGRERLEETREAVKALCEPVEPPYDTDAYLRYFCQGGEGDSATQPGDSERKRLTLYRMVAAYLRAYANLANEMTEAGYTEAERLVIRDEVDHYEKVRQEVKLASGDYVDLKVFEPAMRHLLDSYIRAEDSKVVSKFDDMTLVDLLVRDGADAIDGLPKGIQEQSRCRRRNHREQRPPADRRRDGRQPEVLREDVCGARCADPAAQGGSDRVRGLPQEGHRACREGEARGGWWVISGRRSRPGRCGRSTTTCRRRCW